MYNASIIINKTEFGASLVLGGNTYNASLIHNQPVFQATLAETIRMLPDVNLEQKVNEIEDAVGSTETQTDFLAYYILSKST